MKIRKFRLTNIGRFNEIEILLAPTESSPSNVTVFVGNNGAGKTSLLKSLATSLSWLVARLRFEKGSGTPIPEEVINNDTSFAAIEIEVHDEHVQKTSQNTDSVDSDFHWVIAKTRKGRKSEKNSVLTDASLLADSYRRGLSGNDKMSVPLIAFYPVERVVLDIPLKIKDKHSFLQLDGYDNALNQGVDFRRFFEWFREREDVENESGISQEVFQQITEMLGDKDGVWQMLERLKATSRDRQLTAVRTAISEFMPGFSNLRVRRKPRLYMSVDKNGETLNVAQLSQGEKSLMALIGDIARRLAMMNPSLQNPLNGNGIVLIDEVDLHLHPKWQRSLISRLTSTFPNCQFVLTTHSPLVISDNKDVLCYSLDNGELTQIQDLYGEDANTVLLSVMNTDIRNAEIDKMLHDLLDAIQNSDFDCAKSMIAKLSNVLPESNIELTKARLMLRKQELRHEKNNQD
jgi:predicted ATP-binding protein involved in virulence